MSIENEKNIFFKKGQTFPLVKYRSFERYGVVGFTLFYAAMSHLAALYCWICSCGVMISNGLLSLRIANIMLHALYEWCVFGRWTGTRIQWRCKKIFVMYGIVLVKVGGFCIFKRKNFFKVHIKILIFQLFEEKVYYRWVVFHIHVMFYLVT